MAEGLGFILKDLLRGGALSREKDLEETAKKLELQQRILQLQKLQEEMELNKQRFGLETKKQTLTQGQIPDLTQEYYAKTGKTIVNPNISKWENLPEVKKIRELREKGTLGYVPSKLYSGPQETRTQEQILREAIPPRPPEKIEELLPIEPKVGGYYLKDAMGRNIYKGVAPESMLGKERLAEIQFQGRSKLEEAKQKADLKKTAAQRKFELQKLSIQQNFEAQQKAADRAIKYQELNLKARDLQNKISKAMQSKNLSIDDSKRLKVLLAAKNSLSLMYGKTKQIKDFSDVPIVNEKYLKGLAATKQDKKLNAIVASYKSLTPQIARLFDVGNLSETERKAAEQSLERLIYGTQDEKLNAYNNFVEMIESISSGITSGEYKDLGKKTKDPLGLF